MLYALVSDLFFADVVMRAASSVGERVQTFSTPDTLCQAVAQASPPPLVLLDLSIWDQRLSPCLEAVQHIAGFGPHVAREQFQAARAQGIETLWANSALSQKLGPWIVTNR